MYKLRNGETAFVQQTTGMYVMGYNNLGFELDWNNEGNSYASPELDLMEQLKEKEAM